MGGRRRAVAAAAAISLLVAGYVDGGARGAAIDANAPRVAEDATVVVALGTDRDTLDPQVNSDRDSLMVSTNMFEGLISRDRDGGLIPALAESWESIDDETWRFSLREGVVFHNGEPWNAEAAAFSIERIIDPDYGSLATTYIRGIVGAEVVDELTVDIRTDGLLPSLEHQLVNVMMVPPEAASEEGFDSSPVGTGPYQLDSWDRGQQVVLSRFAEHWGDEGGVETLVFRTIPDEQAALAALQAGEVDVVLDLLPEQIELVPNAVSVEGTEFSNIQLNTLGHEALGDARVRMALQISIDVDTMAEAIYGGFARPQVQHQVPGGLGYNPNLEPYEFDPDRARELLEEAGYPDGFSITLHGAFGRFLKGVDIVEFIASQWTDIGLDVDVRLWEWNTYREVGRIPGDEAGALDTRYNWNRNDFYDGSRYYAHVVCGESSSKFCNDDVDRLFNAAEDTLDQEVRQASYEEAWEVLWEEVSHIRLLQHDSITGVSDRLDWEPRQDERVYGVEMQVTS